MIRKVITNLWKTLSPFQDALDISKSFFGALEMIKNYQKYNTFTRTVPIYLRKYQANFRKRFLLSKMLSIFRNRSLEHRKNHQKYNTFTRVRISTLITIRKMTFLFQDIPIFRLLWNSLECCN